MKTLLFIFIGLLLILNLSAQNKKPKEIKPKNMVFIPQGNYVDTFNPNNDTVSIYAFWISNEVTNAEYKEFLDYAETHPNEELSWVNLKHLKSIKYRNLSTSSIDRKEFTESIKYSEIFELLIDLTKQPYGDYFTNKKYSKYPVVGVSQKAATWYCAWKTELEAREHKEKGKPLYFGYRLPTESEWIYLTSQIQTINNDDNKKEIMPSKKGKIEVLGVRHLLDNVAEWTSTGSNNEDYQLKVVKGGSWTNNQGIYDKKLYTENTTKKDVGFRIVRPYTL
ncbi:formylglycine-generating enzyme family protein [Plebeiibacterium sediminum]|uniref:Formylglycine-generating enzyme family protein n=1 Tax=Plebeiibacterium sediminum TaxID=2992112 RepID=A0AAE3M3M4_9BACT|nr:SUMF1/EgtB/PvdO family nonheme iron enzyme [Plebeiobacterium sediminum]MCW3786524.1 formylglycine-generating enzyme family protein [Plebeiobacterium sediminum]